MKTFKEIESYRHLVKQVHRFCNENGKSYPVLHFVGTVKLHGTNAGVRLTGKQMHPQSRTRLLAVSNDNYGFAFFCEKNKLLLTQLQQKYGEEITIYGEWCGQGIQDQVGISQLPRHFVVFSIWDHTNESYESPDVLTSKLTKQDIQNYNENEIYFINQISEYHLDIDFSHPENSTEEIEKLTFQVESECPWAKFRGIPNSLGEGIVWVCDTIPELWFKSKGILHKKGAQKVKAYTPRLQHKELLEEILPEWRLEQGISYLKENNVPFEKSHIPYYLKWIGNDVIKEEMDILVENNVEWKDIAKQVNNIARQYFLKRIEGDFSC